MIENVQRLPGVVAALHVDPDKRLELARAVEDVLHVGDAELLVQVEAHRGELNRHVGVEASLLDAIQNADVLARRLTGFLLVADTFAKQVEGCCNLLRIQSLDGVESAVERLAGNETSGESLCHSILADEAEDFRLAGEVEQCAAEHRLR